MKKKNILGVVIALGAVALVVIVIVLLSRPAPVIPETLNHLTMFGRISFKSWYAAACEMFDATGIFDEPESEAADAES